MLFTDFFLNLMAEYLGGYGIKFDLPIKYLERLNK